MSQHDVTEKPFGHIGNYPLDARAMAEHSLARRLAVSNGSTVRYQGDNGRVDGWRGDGVTAVPSLVIEVPPKAGVEIRAATEAFQARLPEQYRGFVKPYPTEDLHVTAAHASMWRPGGPKGLMSHVHESIEALDRVMRRLRPFSVRGRGLESLPNCGIWRVMQGGERLTHVKAAIVQSGVPDMHHGVNPHLGPVAPKTDGNWGMTAHATAWVCTGEFPGSEVRAALWGESRLAADATWDVSTLKLNANVHNGDTIHSSVTLATLELGTGLISTASGAEVARASQPQGLHLS